MRSTQPSPQRSESHAPPHGRLLLPPKQLPYRLAFFSSPDLLPLKQLPYRHEYAEVLLCVTLIANAVLGAPLRASVAPARLRRCNLQGRAPRAEVRIKLELPQACAQHLLL